MIIAGEYLEIFSGGSIYTEGVGSDTLPTNLVYSSEQDNDDDYFLSNLESWEEGFDTHIDTEAVHCGLTITDESELLT